MIYIIITIPIFIVIFLLIRSSITDKKIKEIADYTTELLNGNYTHRIIKKEKGNFAALIENLNALAEKLEAKRLDWEEKDILLDILFEGMKEGLVITKKDGEIIKCNSSIKNIFPMVSFRPGKTIQELWINRSFIEFNTSEPEPGKIESLELDISETGKSFLITRFYVEKNQLIFYLFNDITDSRNLKRIKSEFITNLSHEIRTPLTAIKGYLEAIEEPNINKEDRKKFLKIVRENIDRLTNIVSDLLLLSDVERQERKLKTEKIDLNELASEVILLFRRTAENKGIQLEFSPSKIPEYYGDRFLLQQLFINLVSNAVRFTEKGRVEVGIDFENEKFYITVSDTGIGIPSDDIPRIFERFYTVDKSRSRTQGGTGLGLSIVKHIVQLHQGEIKVESKLREGSKFTVILPAIQSPSS